MARKAVVEEAAPVKKPRAKMAVNSFDARMAALAARQQHAESKSAGGNTISVKGGHFSIGGNIIKGDVLRVVIVESIFFNAHYEGPWNEDNPQPPICYAYGVANEDGDEPEMSPHKDCEQPQSEMCEGCPLNEYATADTGRGKACKNQRRVMCILEDDLGDKRAPMYMLTIPPTSIRPWATYAAQVTASEKLPTFCVVTEMTIQPKPGKTYAVLSFAFDHALEEKEADRIEPRIEEAIKLMTQPFPERTEAPKPKRGAKKPSKPEAAVVGRAKVSAGPRKFAARR